MGEDDIVVPIPIEIADGHIITARLRHPEGERRIEGSVPSPEENRAE